MEKNMTDSADKRTPHTDALDTLGLIHWQTEKRDAIHLAVEAVTAFVDLPRAEPIGIIDGMAYPAGVVVNGKQVPYHGIVDPFLHRGPRKGERFWFIMKPREVRSLRHVWEHPDFPEGE